MTRFDYKKKNFYIEKYLLSEYHNQEGRNEDKKKSRTTGRRFMTIQKQRDEDLKSCKIIELVRNIKKINF